MSRRPGQRAGGGRRSAADRHSERGSAAERRQARAARAAGFVRRPFADRPDEGDLVALRELVPSATAPLSLRDPGLAEGRDVLIGTVLPVQWPALVRRDGTVVLALQPPPRGGDLARDLGQALAAALRAEPGTAVTGLGEPTADEPRLQDLVTEAPVQVTVHPGFDWWVAGADPGTLAEDVTASLEQANASVVPTVRLPGVDAAYWCRIGPRCHLRWALREDEESLLDALARLHVSGGGAAGRGLSLGAGTRYVGAFRAAGILVPVWDLPGEDPDDASASRAVEEPARAFQARLTEALRGGPLTQEERRARAGVVSRQVTLR